MDGSMNELLDYHCYIVQWTQQGTVTCEGTVTVCGFSVGTQENWLISHHTAHQHSATRRRRRETEESDCSV